MKLHFRDSFLAASALFLLCGCSLSAQNAKLANEESRSQTWTLQNSGTTAGLRGIDSVDGKVAWASGTAGTVLKTIDGGQHWQKCAIPDAQQDGATLDFRGVQAADEFTALVLSSGKGLLSRVYRTDDGCLHWRLLYKNTEEDGFWDAISIWGFDKVYEGKPKDVSGWIVGDPVGGLIRFYKFSDGYAISGRRGLFYDPSLEKDETESLRADSATTSAFAASNSSFISVPWTPRDGANMRNGTVWPFAFVFVTGGSSGARIYTPVPQVGDLIMPTKWKVEPVPVGSKTESSGAFSIALALDRPSGVIVGGDYAKPNESSGTAAYSSDGGLHWTASTAPPHGYRSSVAWSADLQAWITVGTNGSDISRDDGKTWQPIKDPIMRDGNWNALSLPFVVGPNGRIARLSISGKK
jgi:photosystem II stability/assembly factor-like uncharacterized protein